MVSSEAELKGKMVGLLSTFVTWPNEIASTQAKPLTIGILGDDPFVVSEARGLARRGAAVNLVFDQANNKIRLAINPSMAKNANLQINQGLLRSPLVDIVN